jgi:hypothetical protein
MGEKMTPTKEQLYWQYYFIWFANWGHLMNEPMRGLCNVERFQKSTREELSRLLERALLHLEAVNYYSEKE